MSPVKLIATLYSDDFDFITLDWSSFFFVSPLQNCKTYYNELIALTDANAKHRVRTTQLFEDGLYKLVTMIDEAKVKAR